MFFRVEMLGTGTLHCSTTSLERRHGCSKLKAQFSRTELYVDVQSRHSQTTDTKSSPAEDLWLNITNSIRRKNFTSALLQFIPPRPCTDLTKRTSSRRVGGAMPKHPTMRSSRYFHADRHLRRNYTSWRIVPHTKSCCNCFKG